MRIEVLLSTMHQTDFAIVNKTNIKSDAVIINQCNEEKNDVKSYSFGTIKMISTTDRGLSRSRNLALANSSADICIICDDDVVYVDDYVEIVSKAFREIPDADVIVFNVRRVDVDDRGQERLFRKIEKIPRYKSYGSVHIAFRRQKIIDLGIDFNTYFGTGSGYYSMAEDSLFFREIHKNKLSCYTYPAVFASVSFGDSSWFCGYNEKYFYDLGAFLAAAYPNSKHLFKWYYPFRLKNITKIKWYKMIELINKGINGYNKLMTYEQFVR